MEFLMTYGWAILVVIAAIAALAYFGVLDPSRMLPEKCEFPAGIDCIDKPSIDRTARTISLALKNNIGFTMEVRNASITGSQCQTSNYGIIYNGVSTNITNVSNNNGFTVVLQCTSIPAGKLAGDVTVTYMNTETGLVHNAVGAVRARA